MDPMRRADRAENAAPLAPAGAAFDLTDLDVFEQGFPHEIFTQLRRDAPVYWHAPTPHTPDGDGFWVVSRHADALRILQEPILYSSERGGTRKNGGSFLADTPFAGVMINMMDPPRHDRIRSLVNRGFTPRSIAALEPDLRKRAGDILAPVARAGHCEFVREVARELPLQAICSVLGIPQSERGWLCDCIDVALEHVGRNLQEETEESREASRRVREYGAHLIALKRRQPADDILSVVAHAKLPGEDPPAMTDGELLLFYFLLFVAGSETTRKAIAGGLAALIEHPDQQAALRRDPSLMASAVEEIVRWTTPSVYKRRTVTTECELGGQTLRPGDKITLWEMSANRDERVFDEPFRFDVRRNPNPHIGFGQGIHYCLGANLARLEIRILFEDLFERFDSIELDGPARWTRDNRLFGIKHLPIRFEPSARPLDSQP
jgi:cytochrome P450